LRIVRELTKNSYTLFWLQMTTEHDTIRRPAAARTRKKIRSVQKKKEMRTKMCRNICYRILKMFHFCVVKPISRYSRSNATVWIVGRVSGGGGSGRGAYRIEMQALSTGPEVRGTDLPIIPTHTHICAYVCNPSSQCRHSAYICICRCRHRVQWQWWRCPRVRPYCEDDTELYYYIPEGVQKTNKGDAENEVHLWKLSLYVIYCPTCVRACVYYCIYRAQ